MAEGRDQQGGAGTVEPVALADALAERYLAYALSTIVSRSLPDVRDGLKPVHRRLLYAMSQLRLDPRAGFKKCARVVGDVIGKFHPHGDVAVYEALVRLAQDFAHRYPLVDGQGNFGNIDGDNAAAMRYTEARLTAVAGLLLDGIDEDAVDFRPTYDGEEREPVVLPARFPNLLANGAAGIAVGMATSIPPHNVAEICAALRHLLKHPEATVQDLLAHLPGPDFPTGGILVEPRDGIVEAYETGRGSFRLRARWHVEPQVHGTWRIVVSEIPYQVTKARLVERIAELLAARRLPLLADVRDESAETVRLVLEPRSRTVDATLMMEQLFRSTDLEVRVPLNMNVLEGGVTPRVMTLKEVLAAYLDHRFEVLERRSRHRLAVIERRLEVLEGLLVVFLNLDEVIRIVREEDEPKAALMARFALTEVQAEAILNMRLRQLRKLEEIALRTERDGLAGEREGLLALLADARLRSKAIAADLAEVARLFGPATSLGQRRTTFAAAPDPAILASAPEPEREPVTVLCSEKGWIRLLKGRVSADADLRYKEGDRGRFLVPAMTSDRLLLFASNGRFFTLPCDRLPSGRGHGDPVRLLIDLAEGSEPTGLFVFTSGGRFVVASDQGRGFLVRADDVLAQTRTGKQILVLEEGERALLCVPVPDGADALAVVGSNRRLLLFSLDEVPVMARGRGVRLQRYREGQIADVLPFTRTDGLVWRTGSGVRRETDLASWWGRRGDAGHKVPRGFPASNRFT